MTGLSVAFDVGITNGLIMSFAVVALAISYRLMSFPDLTVEGTLVLSAAVFAALVKSGMGGLPAFSVAVLAGACAGAFTAFLHTHLRLNKFLAGIITVSIAYSLSLRIMRAPNLGLIHVRSVLDSAAAIDARTSPLHGGTILLLLVMSTAAVLVLLFWFSTLPGIRMRLAGSNRTFAESLGVPVRLYLIVGLALTNAVTAISGVLLSVHQGFVDVGMGQGMLILVLSSMVIGERFLPERRLAFQWFIILAAPIGSVAYQALVSVAIQLGAAPTDLRLATALLLVVVMAAGAKGQDELLLN